MKNPPAPTPNPNATPEQLAAWGFYNVQQDPSGNVTYDTSPPPPPVAFDPNSDPTYVQTVGANNQGLSDTYATLGITFDANGNPVYGGGDYLSGAQNYGIDENGNPISANDPRYNPFSRANMLKQSFDRAKANTVNSYASRGQLYAGSVGNEQNYDAGNYAQGYDSLVRNAHGYYADLVAKALSAKDTTGINNAGAVGAAVAANLG